jgi:hypothetical protein
MTMKLGTGNVFDPKAWLRPRKLSEYDGGDLATVLSQHKKHLSRELELATDDQISALLLNSSMPAHKAALVYAEAERRCTRCT